MKPADPTEKLARDYFSRQNRECRTTPELDRQILTAAGEALGRSSDRAGEHRPSGSRLLRLAALPSLLVAALLAILITPHLTTQAWAIDQTIRALRSVKALHLSGWCTYPGQPKREFEIWARPSATDPSVSGDFRLREGDNHLVIVSEKQNTTWVIEKRPPAEGGTVVYVTAGLNRRTPLQTDHWFEALKQEFFNQPTLHWKQEFRDDPQTGRRVAVVTCEGPSLNTARYWKFEFDVDTKLPVRARVWFKPDRQGNPHYDIEHFTYNPDLPEDVFEPPIPEGAQVVDCRAFRKAISPGMGLPVGNVPRQEACRMAAEAYWKAVIDEDWTRARQLRPAVGGGSEDSLKALYREARPVQLSRILFTEHVSDPGTFAQVHCLLKLDDGRTVQSILNVDVTRFNDGSTTAAVAGAVGPEFIPWRD